MELGQRIRDARLQAGLSQKALCGNTITRNMLSLIESGKAKPSMETLKILSERLGKTISYFLEEDAVLSPNQQLMTQAKAAFSAKEYKSCLSLLDSYQPDRIFDDEKALLLDLARLELAQIALEEQRHIYAKNLLHSMEFAGIYQVSERKRQQQILLAKAGEDAVLPSDDGYLLLKAEQYLRNAQCEKAAAQLNAMESRDGRWHLLQGQIYMQQAQYGEALPHLLEAEPSFPTETIPLLEQCYRELDDYKMAYTYALKLRGE